MRLAVIFAALLSACSDSSTTTQDMASAVSDLAVGHDLAGVRLCGIDDPPITCPGLTPGAPNCWICDYGAPQQAPGVCARACNGPSDCRPTQTCLPFGGDGGSATVQAGGCSQFTGFCR
jgi:hypothetical protein